MKRSTRKNGRGQQIKTNSLGRYQRSKSEYSHAHNVKVRLQNCHSKANYYATAAEMNYVVDKSLQADSAIK